MNEPEKCISKENIPGKEGEDIMDDNQIISYTDVELMEFLEVWLRTPINQKDEVFDKFCRAQLAKEDARQIKLRVNE